MCKGWEFGYNLNVKTKEYRLHELYKKPSSEMKMAVHIMFGSTGFSVS